MIILGVDPGTLFTGYAVIRGVDKKLKLLHYDIINIPPKFKLAARLKLIYDSLVDVINLYNPDEFAIETAFYSKNVQSTLKLGHARGVSILAAANNNIPAAEYSPREIKKAVSGLGAASKEQIKYIVCKTFGINLYNFSKKLDISDAAAVALCHHYKLLNFKTSGLITNKISSNWGDYVKLNPKKVIIH